MYYLLTESFKSQETLITDIIRKKVDPVRVYFLGSTLNQERCESIFMPDAPSRSCVGHYYLLVTIENLEKKASYYQDIIENSCNHIISVTAIVLSEQCFLDLVNSRTFFAGIVNQRAVSLFLQPETVNIKKDQFENVGAMIIPDEKKKLIDSFLLGAEFYISKDHRGCALFLLHQAIEQMLHSLLLKHTGLKFNTHNLDKLIRYSYMINFKMSAIFPRQSLPAVNLIRLVQASYYGTRYNPNFKVAKSDVLKIYSKAKSMREFLNEE